MTKVMSRKLNLVMNNLIEDKKDPTKLHFTMSILDGETSHNNVKVLGNGLSSLAKSVKGMPIVAKLIVNEDDRSKDDFGDHEASLAEDRSGNKYWERGTIPIGSFIDDGYVETRVINGIETEVLMGNGVLWATRYPDIVNLVKDMFESGIKINTSSEYKYDATKVTFNELDEEIHDMDLYFEGTAVLGSDSNYVPPAYDSATFLALNKKKTTELNLLVAQAIKKEEGDKNLSTQLNRVSFETIQKSAKSQIATVLNDIDYMWITDASNEDVVVAVESEDYSVNYYQFNYTLSEDGKVNLDLESKKEVVESRTWTSITNELSEKVEQLEGQLNSITSEHDIVKNELEKLEVSMNERITELVDEKETITTELNAIKVEKLDLAEQLNKSNDVIVGLNNEIKLNKATIEELAPFKEKVQEAEHEAVLNSAKEEFEAKFNSVEGDEVFATEEVQNLVMNSVLDGEEGLNAKLQLSQMIIELASKKLQTTPDLATITNSKSKRDFSSLVKSNNDILDDLR